MVEQLDPNWFYSTLAQSTAAMVGLAGAFLMQRLLNQHSALAEPRSELRTRLQSFANTVQSQRSGADLVARTSGDVLNVADRFREFSDFPVGADTPVHVFMDDVDSGPQGWQGIAGRVPQQARGQIKEAGDVAATYRDALPTSFEDLVSTLSQGPLAPPSGAEWLAEPPSQTQLPPWSSDFVAALPHQRDAVKRRWQYVRDQAQVLVQEIEAFQSKVAPQSLWLLWGILTGMLAAGVVAPMFSLSAHGGSRNLLLALFIPLAGAFNLYFGIELFRLRRARDLTRREF